MPDKYELFLDKNKKVKLAADDQGNFFAEANGNRIKLGDDGLQKFGEGGVLEAIGGGGGLEGTQYVFVAANGTDVENAAELQAAYNTAVSKVITTTELITLEVNPFYYTNYGQWNIHRPQRDFPNYFPTTGFYDVVINGVTYNMEVLYLEGTVAIWVVLPDTVTEINSFAIPNTNSVPSTVVAANGFYNFSSDFVMDTDSVSLVSLDGNKSIIFNGDGTLSVEADNVFVKGVDVQTKAFKVSYDLPNTTIESCSGGDSSFGGSNGILSGTFNNCTGGNLSFANWYGTLTGTFNNCTAGDNSFGGFNGTLTGNFTNCTGGDRGFGGSGYSTLSGTFNNCTGGTSSFGGSDGGTLTGNFTNCTGGTGAFGGGRDAIASGNFKDCTGGNGAFAGFEGTASGNFTNCTGGSVSFGAVRATASGNFTNCIGGNNSFGGSYDGIASGTFINCTGGYYSFGSYGSGATLSGKLYYCRQTSGTFNTVSGGGRTFYCIDGENNTNNQ